LGDDGVKLLLTMLPGTAFRVEASEDLAQWAGVYSATASAGAVEWTDPAAGEQGRRFYRAVREQGRNTSRPGWRVPSKREHDCLDVALRSLRLLLFFSQKATKETKKQGIEPAPPSGLLGLLR